MNPNDWSRAAASAARHRLTLIQAAYADLPATPAIEQLFRAIAWELSHAELEAFCSIPAALRGGASAGRIELPL
jgi:hypothetical protein